MAYLKHVKNSKVSVPDSENSPKVTEGVVDAGYLGQKTSKLKSIDPKKLKLFGIIVVVAVIGIFVLKLSGGKGGGGINLTPGISPEAIISKENALNEGPKTVENPINGVMYTEKRADIWKARRPLAVDIENHIESRPAYGLSDADQVFEAVAEGGITRFVAIFWTSQAPRLEPIRSIRNYFIDWAGDFDAIVVHHGGANSQDPRTDALGNITKLGLADIDCIKEDGGICTRDNERFAPHNSMSNTAVLWNEAQKRGFNKPTNFETYKFKDDAEESLRPLAQKISYNFWQDEDYLVRWEYDKTSNSYKRINGNLLTDKHMDANYPDRQITSKTVIVQKMVQGPVNDGTSTGHLLYNAIGTGQALIFSDGKMVTGTWEKTERTKRTKFFDAKGAEVVFNRGQIWISVVPPENVITVN